MSKSNVRVTGADLHYQSGDIFQLESNEIEHQMFKLLLADGCGALEAYTQNELIVFVRNKFYECTAPDKQNIVKLAFKMQYHKLINEIIEQVVHDTSEDNFSFSKDMLAQLHIRGADPSLLDLIFSEKEMIIPGDLTEFDTMLKSFGFYGGSFSFVCSSLDLLSTRVEETNLVGCRANSGNNDDLDS